MTTADTLIRWDENCSTVLQFHIDVQNAELPRYNPTPSPILFKPGTQSIATTPSPHHLSIWKAVPIATPTSGAIRVFARSRG